MESDDAADVIAALPPERRGRVLALLPPVQRRRVETLLGYAEGTAGSLMSLDHVTVGPAATVTEALRDVVAAPSPEEALAAVFVVGEDGRLIGGVTLVALLRAPESAVVSRLDALFAQRLREEDSLEEVARLMTDFDLVIVPVVDDDDRLVGAITFDDVLEVAVPRDWRRQRRLLADDDG
jgi:Mg/Co/Ni transporter MgtE